MSSRRAGRYATRLLASALICCLSPIARGASPDAAPAESGNDGGLEEIVVVAQKRSVNIQKAPEAITAVTGATLDQQNVVDPVDLNGLVPSLVITTSEGLNNSVAIRGIGFNVPQNDAAQPSVSYHIDGIYVANPIALGTGFLDVDHVEVLRGPQGTVFGQNSVGGTINVISKLPTLDGFGGSTDLSVGTYSLVRFRAAVNLPIDDTIAIRASIDQSRHDGFANATQVTGTNGHYDLDNDDSVHARLQLLWKPTDDFSALLRADYADADNHEAEFKNILDPNTDPRQESSDWPGRFQYRQELYSATLTYNLPVATLKSLTSWQSVDQGGSLSEDGLYTALASTIAPNFYHDIEYTFHKSMAITQEVDLSSLPGGDLDWIVGAFFLNGKEKVGYDQYDLTPGDMFDANLLYSPPLGEVPNNLYFQSDSKLTRQSWSFYAQGTYHVTDYLRITGGARYTHDSDTTNISDFFNLYGPPVYVQSSANVVTGKAEIEADITQNNLVYVSYSTGFKPGGGNISLEPLVVPYEFKPETITSYEIGSKNAFLDNRVRLNIAAFYYDYKNLQYEAEDLAPFQGGVDNIPASQVYGVEAEASYLLPYNLRLDTSATLERGRITSHFLALDNVAGNQAVAFAASQNVYLNSFSSPYSATEIALLKQYRGPAYRDVYGNAPPMLPEITASVSLSHTLDLADGSSLLSRLQVQYRDKFADAIFGNNPIYTAPSSFLVNLYFDYVLANPDWDTSLSITNVTDTPAVVSRFTNQFGGETTQSYAPPRQVIFRVGYKF
jgi:iron complex outermembrane receptor protein